MIDLYTFSTPNGRKIPILLEELGLPYQVHSINILKGDQHRPEYLKINPNGKIPAIIDHDTFDGKPLTIFESGAILIYLAEKAGRFIGKNIRSRTEVLQWLMFQMSAIGPMFGQFNHFSHAAPEKIPYAIERYGKEVSRIMGVVESHLSDRDYFSEEYSIADISSYAWIQGVVAKASHLLPSGASGIRGWLERVGSRPAVQKGMTVP